MEPDIQEIEKLLEENKIIIDQNNLNQYFIKDKSLLKRIVDAASISRDDVVFEIGTGIGNLTEHIVDRARFVYSTELDIRFKPILDKLCEKHDNLRIVYGNALKIEWPKFTKLVSSIPYNIAEPLLLKLIDQEFESCTLVVSKHFADLITSENEHRLSAIIPCFFKVMLLEIIPPSAFYPTPKIDSAMIVIKPLEKGQILRNPIGYLICEIFKRRYSKLKNSLMNAMIVWTAKMKGKILTKRKSREFIANLNLDQKILEKVVDNMSGKEFKFLSDHLRNRIEGIYSYCA